MSASLFPLRREKSATAAIEVQIQEAQLPEPEPEYQFAKALGRKWKFDLAWPAHRIAFEQEGATFGRVIRVTQGFEHRKGKRIPIKSGTVIRLGGRHQEGTGFDKDCEKYGYAAALGWCVIRSSTRMIRDGEALTLLKIAFKLREGSCNNT